MTPKQYVDLLRELDSTEAALERVRDAVQDASDRQTTDLALAAAWLPDAVQIVRDVAREASAAYWGGKAR